MHEITLKEEHRTQREEARNKVRELRQRLAERDRQLKEKENALISIRIIERNLRQQTAAASALPPPHKL